MRPSGDARNCPAKLCGAYVVLGVPIKRPDRLKDWYTPGKLITPIYFMQCFTDFRLSTGVFPRHIVAFHPHAVSSSHPLP